MTRRCTGIGTARRLVGTACAMLLVLAAAGRADMPVAPEDVPGFRPASSEAGAFLAALDTATLAVHPTIVRRATRTAASFASQRQAMERLETAGIATVAGNLRLDLGPPVARSQWELFQSDLARVAEAVRSRSSDAQYHLVLELLLPVSDDEIFGIECYIVDPQGNNAFSFLLNAHHRPFVEAQLFTDDSSEASRDAMTARATDAAMSALLEQVARARAHEARSAARDAALAAGDYVEVVFDDFESPVTALTDPFGIPIGFRPFTDGRSAIRGTTTDAHPPVPGESPGNHVLSLEIDLEGWAAFGHLFAFDDPEGPFWMPYDWRAFDGIAFWLHGQDSGAIIFVDILDNRSGDATRDTAERYTWGLADDFTGWRRIVVPFSDFERKEVGNGAPNDGLDLAQVHGWAIGAANARGSINWLIDDVTLQRVGAAPARDPEAGYAINELPMYGLREKTPEQQRADADYIDMMTAGGRSREAAAETAAKNAWNVLRFGDAATAIRRFNQAWLLDPDNRLALWGFAVTCIDRGQYEDAARFYRMAIENGPEDPRLSRDYRLALRQLDKLGPGAWREPGVSVPD